MLGHLLDRLRRWFGYTSTTDRDEGASAVPDMLPMGAASPLIEDCRHRGPGVYYLYVRGEVHPVYVGMARDVRHRLRKHRYNLQNGWYPENPPVHDVSYTVQPTTTEAEARRVERAEIRALRPRWNGTGMSETHVRRRKQAAAEQPAAKLADQT
jgi:predicted GIY-YIG superfamily endonuclease